VVVKPTAPPSPAPTASRTSQPAPTPQPSLTPRPAPTRFAVIGDYGTASDAEAAVAALVAGWGVEFVVTVGDNNYPDGAAATIDANVGQFYHAFIHPYRGAYGAGADRQRAPRSSSSPCRRATTPLPGARRSSSCSTATQTSPTA
jgi:hypothetical protein